MIINVHKVKNIRKIAQITWNTKFETWPIRIAWFYQEVFFSQIPQNTLFGKYKLIYADDDLCDYVKEYSNTGTNYLIY